MVCFSWLPFVTGRQESTPKSPTFLAAKRLQHWKKQNEFITLSLSQTKMATIDSLRNGLIDKILSIKNREFLEALDKLISSTHSESEIVELTPEQKMILEMSKQDIITGMHISQEAMDKRNLEWLNAI